LSRHPIVGILLAAGEGTRFGGDKLEARLPDGTPVGLRSLSQLLTVVDTVIAVVRSADAALQAQFEAHGARVTRCPHASSGMGASLAWGVRAAPVAAGWLVSLGDMPWIEPETIRRVTVELRAGRGIAIPTYGHRRGHPVGFAARFYDRLIALHGDQGARSLCQTHATDTMLIDTNDPGIVRDVDVRSDLEPH
jgi:molybdenum cofactor cytidylyltransferase